MGESKFSEDAYESKFSDGGESKRAGAGGRDGAGKAAAKPAAKKGGEGKRQARDENTIHTLVTKATSYCFCKFPATPCCLLVACRLLADLTDRPALALSCWPRGAASDFIGIFERYIKDNAYIFHDAARSGSTEHSLEFTELFEDYLQLYEKTMEGWLEQEGLTLEEFHEALAEAQEHGKSGDKYFIKLLIASGEYDCFYDV
jgi:hypothetical protein